MESRSCNKLVGHKKIVFLVLQPRSTVSLVTIASDTKQHSRGNVSFVPQYVALLLTQAQQHIILYKVPSRKQPICGIKKH